MASAVFRSNCHNLLRRIVTSRCNCNNVKQISTSQKNKDGATTVNPQSIGSKAIPDFANPEANKNWVSYGFDRSNQNVDLYTMHSLMFVSISLCLVVGGFYFAYMPDTINRDWTQRQAFLEIRRREQLGLPLIDKNYIPENKIILPTDEELGDTEIII